MAGAAA
ncbi:hypothetical protein YPPY91_0748, partial [Yersinia pestis PY-91]